nr:uncharacterized protein LOC106625627 [Bactrocera oleae]
MFNNNGRPPPYSLLPPGFTPATCYEPLPQEMPPPPQQTSTVFITINNRPIVPLDEDPTRMQCPSCHADVLTTVKYQSNTCTHIWALVLCLFLYVKEQKKKK